MDDKRTFRFPDDYRAAPKPEPPVFQVWHDQEWVRRERLPAATFPEDFEHVANVRARGLQHAVALTTDVNHDLLAPRPLVAEVGFLGRDTAPGDVIVTPSGRPYRYEGETFTEIARSDQPAVGPVPSVAEILADPVRHLAPEQAHGQGHDHGPGNGRKM